MGPRTRSDAGEWWSVFENEDVDVIGARAQQSVAKLERDRQSMLLKQIHRVDRRFENQPVKATPQTGKKEKPKRPTLLAPSVMKKQR